MIKPGVFIINHRNAGLSLFFLLCVLTCKSEQDIPDTAILAQIENEPVIVREFMQQSKRLRPYVIQFYRTVYGCEYNEGFWNQSFDGKTPTDMLKQKTLDTIKSIKVQQLAAKKYGIETDITYSGFLSSLEKENQRRLEAKQQNQVIYGPVQYSEDVYFSYRFSNMVNSLKTVLDKKVFRITEGDLKESYENEKDNLYRSGYITKAKIYRIVYKPDGTAKTKEEAFAAIQSIKDICDGNAAQEREIKIRAFTFAPGVSFFQQDVNFNDSVYSPEEDNATKAAIKETTRALQENQTSEVMEFEDEFVLICILQKKSLGYRSFEKCREVVRSSITDHNYSKYIADLIQKAELSINSSVFDKILY